MSSMTTTDNKAFLNELARLVGHSHLLTDPAKTARYRKGFRSGQGDALAVADTAFLTGPADLQLAESDALLEISLRYLDQSAAITLSIAAR